MKCNLSGNQNSSNYFLLLLGYDKKLSSVQSNTSTKYETKTLDDGALYSNKLNGIPNVLIKCSVDINKATSSRKSSRKCGNR